MPTLGRSSLSDRGVGPNDGGCNHRTGTTWRTLVHIWKKRHLSINKGHFGDYVVWEMEIRRMEDIITEL